MENTSREELELSHLEKELTVLNAKAKLSKTAFIGEICLWIATSIWAAFDPSVLWLVFFTGSLMILSIVLWIVYSNKTRAKQVEIENKKDFIALSKQNLSNGVPNDLSKNVPPAQEQQDITAGNTEQNDIKNKLLKLNNLLEEGLITIEEFESSKKELLRHI